MKMVHKLGLAAALLASTQVAMASSVDMGFESGNLSGWTSSGNASVTSAPGYVYSGKYAAEISGASTLQKMVYVAAGQTVDFMWRFIAGDYLPFNDFAFSVNGSGYTKLADVASVGNYGDSGWNYFKWTVNPTYNGPLLFSVVNIGDNAVDSKLLLDAPVPLPGAALLFGSALLGAGALRRKQAAAKKSEMALA